MFFLTKRCILYYPEYDILKNTIYEEHLFTPCNSLYGYVQYASACAEEYQ